jgi:glycosyltransferase involved in cell wall biosynthesis
MNSVEALSMGLCCVTELVPDYVDFIPDHPFVNVTAESLYAELKKLLKHPELILEHKTKGRDWVVEKHDYRQTADVLYNYYNEKGWLV